MDRYGVSGRSEVRGKLGVAVALVAAMMMMAAMTSSAFAGTPTGKFAVFSDCPVTAPDVNECIYAKITSGGVKLGNAGVPISQTLILQGGDAEESATGAESFVGAVDGNTLVKTPQPVPGGLLGLAKCKEVHNFVQRLVCQLVLETGATSLTATTELAAPASSIGINEGHLIATEGAGLTLPIKVKLENPLLGNECYIGSDAHPIVLNLTTGATSPPLPNTPISGSSGIFHFEDQSEYALDSGVSLVENAFAAPGVEGCGGPLSYLIDPVLDGKDGLPSAAGNNTAVLNAELQIVSSRAVQASEN